jgi:hypothetical protein
MRVRIDREREERRIPTGWFARATIPVYCVRLTIHFSEEERYLIHHTGIGHYVFIRTPIPPDITDPETIRSSKPRASVSFSFVIFLAMIRRQLWACGPTLSPRTKRKRLCG